MLTEIHIRHLATIEEVHLELPPGTIVITGETGAGKSIIMEAVELALGERATPSVIRKGCEKAEISLNFIINEQPEAISWLQNNDFHLDANECMIRRIIFSDGRSRSYINGVPSTQQAVRELSALLLQVHGQFEQHALLKSEKQRNVLDHYAAHEQLAAEVNNLALSALELQENITTFTDQIDEAKQHNEFLHFQLSELNALHLEPNEWLTLENDQRKLANAEELIHHVHQVLQHLADAEEHTVSQLLNESLKSLQSIQSVEKKTASWMESLTAASIQIRDTEQELRDYLEKVEIDPEQLQHIEQRIQQIHMIARKYKTQPEALLTLKEDLQKQIADSTLSEQRLAELEEKLRGIVASYQKSAKTLSNSRLKAAKKLAKEVTRIIQDLSLPHGEMQIELSPETSNLSPHGLEKIHFLMKTNPGQPLQLLTKVLSGGELSRTSLAIHLVTADQYNVSSLVFDEVDTGISGAIAEKVGKLLRRLGESCQVLCVTHLPQVAAQGHHHLLVQKTIRDGAPFTQIHLLNQKEKTAEIARMLSGEKITDAVLEHAKEMLVVE